MSQPPDSIILLHGLGSSFEHNWRRTGWVDILADFGCSAPEIDLPGHGRAMRSHDPSDYNSIDVDVFSALPSDKPMTAVGFSAGARLLLRIAVSHPESFDKIVLLGWAMECSKAAIPARIPWQMPFYKMRSRRISRCGCSTDSPSQAVTTARRWPL